MITIHFNGEKKEIQENLTIQNLLNQYVVCFQQIVVEYNLEIIQKNKFKEIILKDGDQVEILKFVGGG